MLFGLNLKKFYLAYLFVLQYQVVNAALLGRLNSPDQFNQHFKVSLGDACDLTAAKCGVCDNLMYLLFGYDAPQMNTVGNLNVFE